jgi:hypothetical protein
VNHAEPIKQNTHFLTGKSDGTYNYHSASNEKESSKFKGKLFLSYFQPLSSSFLLSIPFEPLSLLVMDL